MSRIKFLVGSLLILFLVQGCNPAGTWKKQERDQIATYIKALGDTVYSLKPSGLYYIELLAGTGRMPVVNDTVGFRYKAMFIDRVVFDSNITAPAPWTAVVGTNNINFQILLGIDEGVRYMKQGGKARLVLPSSLAYGATGVWGSIPGYTPLLFEIELVSVKPGSK
jgi:peptidyl-prolyl cis-trans isomerase A (cyclophilin A)